MHDTKFQIYGLNSATCLLERFPCETKTGVSNLLLKPTPFYVRGPSASHQTQFQDMRALANNRIQQMSLRNWLRNRQTDHCASGWSVENKDADRSLDAQWASIQEDPAQRVIQPVGLANVDPNSSQPMLRCSPTKKKQSTNDEGSVTKRKSEPNFCRRAGDARTRRSFARSRVRPDDRDSPSSTTSSAPSDDLDTQPRVLDFNAEALSSADLKKTCWRLGKWSCPPGPEARPSSAILANQLSYLSPGSNPARFSTSARGRRVFRRPVSAPLSGLRSWWVELRPTNRTSRA